MQRMMSFVYKCILYTITNLKSLTIKLLIKRKMICIEKKCNPSNTNTNNNNNN